MLGRILIYFLIALIPCCLTICGCASKETQDPNKKTIKIEITGNKAAEGAVIHGDIEARDAVSAGLKMKNFEIKIPGSVEIQGGTSEYGIHVYDFNRGDMVFHVYINGKKLERGNDILIDEREGFNAIFKIEGEGGAKKE